MDSGRGSDTEASEGSEGPGGADLRGRTWATAVALRWLGTAVRGRGEWNWQLQKADCWLRAQHLPDGLDLANLKAAGPWSLPVAASLGPEPATPPAVLQPPQTCEGHPLLQLAPPPANSKSLPPRAGLLSVLGRVG